MSTTKLLEARVLAAAVGAAIGAWAPVAWGAGFALTEQNASGLGNAYVGAAAVAEDASTIYFNPAGMTRIKGRQAVGALSLISPTMRFRDDGTSTVPGVGLPGVQALQAQGGGNGGNAGSLAAVPAAYLSWELQPGKWWLGVGLGAPFGLSTEWDKGWIGRFHAIESSVEALTLNPTFAWKASETVSLAAGLSIQQLKATLSNAVPYGASVFDDAFRKALATGASPAQAIGAADAAVTGLGVRGLEGVGVVDGDSTSLGWNVGATFQVSEATRVGVAYRSKIRHRLDGDIAISDRPAALAALGALPDGAVKATITLPDSFSLAVAHELNPRWQLLADYTWTGWSSIPKLAIERPDGSSVSSSNLAFRNTWRLGVAANYRCCEQWTLRFGLAYDRSPVQDAERTPRLPDKSRIWTGVGAQYRTSAQTAFDVGLVYLWIPDASSELTTSSGGALRGRYEASTWILGAQVRYSF